MRPDLASSIALARELHAPDPLEWRRRIERAVPSLAPDDLREVLTQAELANRLAATWGTDAPHGWWLTRDGLEQGTHPRVADLRAQHIAATGATRVIDLTAGLGFDTAACVRAGLTVISVERDPLIAEYCAHNVPVATVICADAAAYLDQNPPAVTDVLLVDPARRTGVRTASGARALPERDPHQWSPSIDAVQRWAEHHRVALKAAPSFAGLDDWSVQWVARERTMVESAWYSWTLDIGARSAAVVTGSGVYEFPHNACALPETDHVGEGDILVEVNPAVARAHAWPVSENWAQLNNSWLRAPGDVPSLEWGRRYRALSAWVTRKAVPQLLKDHNITRAAIKTGATSDDPAHLRAQWKIADDDRFALIVLADHVVVAERMRTAMR